MNKPKFYSSWDDLPDTPKVGLDYKCPKCWAKRHIIYKRYDVARKNRVYCDFCIVEEMRCITPNWMDRINILN